MIEKMTDMERLNALLVTLGHLTELNKSGHKIAKEINLVVAEIVKELGLEQ